MQLYALPYDRWEGYAAERKQLLADLVGVKNVVVLTTDTHAHLIGEIRTTTFEPRARRHRDLGGHHGPRRDEHVRPGDRYRARSPGSGDFVTSLFLKPPLPRGLGLRCAATDTYGYSRGHRDRARRSPSRPRPPPVGP